MRLETAQANARAAEANEKAEHERLERLKIEEKLSKRILSREQQLQIIDELRPFAGKSRVEVFAYINLDEVVWLREQIWNTLREAGWDARGNVNSRVAASLVNGISVEIAPGTTREIGEAAMAIVLALNRVGLMTGGPIGSHNLREAPIEILVGNKP
jgi:hypothetical protein